jgi:putative SOS response-associated peptidase YedK
MPSPFFALKGRNSDPGVTNVRNVKSPHWRRWLGIQNRCVVPFTSFSENEKRPDGPHPPVWFALDETRPLAFFAGIWTRWTSVRKVKEGETTNDLFAFLTTEPNKVVGAVHPKAMPVILTTREEIDVWMSAPAEEALKLQRPLADDALMIVARGEKKDEGSFGDLTASPCPQMQGRPCSAPIRHHAAPSCRRRSPWPLSAKGAVTADMVCRLFLTHCGRGAEKHDAMQQRLKAGGHRGWQGRRSLCLGRRRLRSVPATDGPNRLAGSTRQSSRSP